MRQFKLVNSAGSELSLNQPGKMYLYDPVGLGWGYATGYADVGDAYIPTDTVLQHPAPSGWILFGGYSDYNTFLAFIQGQDIKLAYMPESTWYYLDCSVIISKGDINPATKRLHCDVAFSGTSHWYAANKIYTAVGGTATFGKIVLPSYCKITIDGAASNPVWTLYDTSNNAIASGKVNTSIAAGKKLVINSRPRDMDIAKYTGTVRDASLYTDSDFTTERFIEIPAGAAGQYMTFADDNGTLNATVEVYERV